MGMLDGRVAICTGSGRGVGAEVAKLMAANGAKVVVNDPGTSGAGEGFDQTPAQQIVDEIKAAGGDAIADPHLRLGQPRPAAVQWPDHPRHKSRETVKGHLERPPDDRSHGPGAQVTDLHRSRARPGISFIRSVAHHPRFSPPER